MKEQITNYEQKSRHCGLDPQSPENSAGDSCFRRNDEVGKWNDGVDWNEGAIPLLWRGRGGHSGLLRSARKDVLRRDAMHCVSTLNY